METNISNPKSGDRDSQGPFQQRPSQGWGSPSQVTNVKHAAGKFFDAAARADKGQSSGQLAQDVQRSAYPSRYNQVGSRAGAILRSTKGGGSAASRTRTVPGTDRSGDRQALLQQYLSMRHDPSALLALKKGLDSAQDTPSRSVKVRGVDLGPSDSHGGSIKTAAGADRPGARTQPAVRQFVRKISGLAGAKLTIGTGTNHSQMTVDGNVSDHWSGHAADVPAKGTKLVRLGQAALIAAGMPKAKARKQKGGLYNVNGHQIIFNTHEGGDHTDHLHVSAK